MADQNISGENSWQNTGKISRMKRIVIKIGSSSLTHPSGLIHIRQMESFVKVLSDLKNAGYEIILVTSGAQAVGMGKLRWTKDSVIRDMPARQALAAVGQCELMHLYDEMFSRYHHVVAQVLLTRFITDHAESRQNVINTLFRLLDAGCIPIINENDSVSFEEIEFGDNDTLSAIVGVLAQTELLAILSDIDGLYDSDPRKNPGARFIPLVSEISDEILSAAGAAGSSLGTGGMITKLKAARIGQAHGFDTVILNGRRPEILYELFDDRPVGTRFLHSSSGLRSEKGARENHEQQFH